MSRYSRTCAGGFESSNTGRLTGTEGLVSVAVFPSTFHANGWSVSGSWGMENSLDQVEALGQNAATCSEVVSHCLDDPQRGDLPLRQVGGRVDRRGIEKLPPVGSRTDLLAEGIQFLLQFAEHGPSLARRQRHGGSRFFVQSDPLPRVPADRRLVVRHGSHLFVRDPQQLAEFGAGRTNERIQRRLSGRNQSVHNSRRGIGGFLGLRRRRNVAHFL